MTFFSGTDLSTLKSEGNDANHFVSVIVNNAGVYSAAITRKVTYLSKGKSIVKYNTFNNVPVEESEADFEREESAIEYYPLEVIREALPEVPKSELELRLEEVRANANSYINKKAKTPTSNNKDNKSTVITPTTQFGIPHIYIPSLEEERKEAKQLSLFEEEIPYKNVESSEKTGEDKVEYPDLDMSIAYDEDHIDESIVNDTITQVITGDLFSTYKPNVDINKWVTNMERLYDKRFDFANYQFTLFSYWIDSLLEYIENEVFDEDLYKKGRDYMDAIWAYDTIVKLQEFPKNKYIDKIVESLERWLI